MSAACKETPMACNDCHQADDMHERTLGIVCGQCRNPNGWVFWVFDHDTQTEYTPQATMTA